MKPKHCTHCSNQIYGRSDKRFCDDSCRSAFNNKIRYESGTVRKVNLILHRNRRILEQMLPSEKQTLRIRKQRLIDQGFNFSYVTHSKSSKSGSVYSFCYEYGYLPVSGEACLLVRNSE